MMSMNQLDVVICKDSILIYSEWKIGKNLFFFHVLLKFLISQANNQHFRIQQKKIHWIRYLKKKTLKFFHLFLCISLTSLDNWDTTFRIIIRTQKHVSLLSYTKVGFKTLFWSCRYQHFWGFGKKQLDSDSHFSGNFQSYHGHKN